MASAARNCAGCAFATCTAAREWCIFAFRASATKSASSGAAGGQILAIQNLEAWYGESHILHGVNFNVNAGEVVTLLGRNGAGKTTTLK